MIDGIRDLDVAARTLWGEARGEPDEGKAAVAWVIRNRAAKTGKRLAEICLAPWQFSCWNPADPNAGPAAALTCGDPLYLQGLEIVCRVMRRPDDVDPTHGARHYFRDDLAPWPEWARGHTPCAHVGRHLFFNDVK